MRRWRSLLGESILPCHFLLSWVFPIVLAFCPYCKKKVAVYTELKEEEAPSEIRPVAVMCVGPDWDRIWLAR